ncbi:hypothetical protein FALBO_17269, partial [Fusarium albosuccineum]
PPPPPPRSGPTGGLAGAHTLPERPATSSWGLPSEEQPQSQLEPDPERRLKSSMRSLRNARNRIARFEKDQEDTVGMFEQYRQRIEQLEGEVSRLRDEKEELRVENEQLRAQLSRSSVGKPPSDAKPIVKTEPED